MFHCQRRVSTAIKMLHTCTCNLHCEWPLLFPLLLSLRLLFSSLFLSILSPPSPLSFPFPHHSSPLPSPHSTPFLPPILLPSFPHSSPSPLSLFPLSTPFSSFLVPLSSPPLSSLLSPPHPCPPYSLLPQTGQTILHYACALGQVDVILYLLSRPDCKLSEQDKVSQILSDDTWADKRYQPLKCTALGREGGGGGVGGEGGGRC